MGNYIIRLEDKYLIWSTVVDAPTTKAMTREELEKYYLVEYGRAAYNDLHHRMARVDEKGTSAIVDNSAMNTVACNRAGPDEATLSYEQIVNWYVRGVKPTLSVLQAKHPDGKLVRVAAYCFEDAQRVYENECCVDGTDELPWETGPGEWLGLNRGLLEIVEP